MRPFAIDEGDPVLLGRDVCVACRKRVAQPQHDANLDEASHTTMCRANNARGVFLSSLPKAGSLVAGRTVTVIVALSR
jgi:hypothetical protein